MLKFEEIYRNMTKYVAANTKISMPNTSILGEFYPFPLNDPQDP